ncbi:hypothetical protein PR048_030520 [Dryococelus australis]|uniref:BHLH domain-containing protein n=1 Tax=Dryococelus australis TaxID=614101 RepID=A0ABQ9GD23_9NEOP|nr:hypothetical protein PR048_030520 [Dryococelus australis]
MDFNLTFQMPPLLSLQTQFSEQPALEPSTDPNNNNNNNNDDGDAGADRVDEGQAKGEKYSLRPRSGQKRVACDPVVERVAGKRSSGSRPKQKPPPLSKYRRKTANARERDRMREINAAFESLRRAIPHSPAESCPSAGEKLTKITTLRLAMKYIAALSQALQQEPAPRDFDLVDLLSDCGGDAAPDLDALLLESDDDSLCLRSDLSDSRSFTPPDFASDHSADYRSSLTTPVFGDPADLDQLFS